MKNLRYSSVIMRKPILNKAGIIILLSIGNNSLNGKDTYIGKKIT